jgi:hypothetical protein
MARSLIAQRLPDLLGACSLYVSGGVALVSPIDLGLLNDLAHLLIRYDDVWIRTHDSTSAPVARKFRSLHPRAKLGIGAYDVLYDTTRGSKGMDDAERLKPRYDSAVRETPPHAEESDVAEVRGSDLA